MLLDIKDTTLVLIFYIKTRISVYNVTSLLQLIQLSTIHLNNSLSLILLINLTSIKSSNLVNGESIKK